MADAVQEALAELRRATRKFGAFASTHEGYAVILEELDELWDAIKANDQDAIGSEAVQVAAMALRFLHDQCGMSLPEEPGERQEELRFASWCSSCAGGPNGGRGTLCSSWAAYELDKCSCDDWKPRRKKP